MCPKKNKKNDNSIPYEERSSNGVKHKYELNKTNFGERLRILRKARYKLYSENKHLYGKNPYEVYKDCKSQDSFGEKLGCNQRTVGRWEQGKLIPSLDQANAICRILHCDPDYLFGGGDIIEQKNNNEDSIEKEIAETDIIGRISNAFHIKKDILFLAINNDLAYISYLNFFADPKRCKRFYSHLDNANICFWIDHTEIDGITGPLRTIIEDSFHRASMYCASEEDKLMDTFISQLSLSLSKKKITFTKKKEETKLEVTKYIKKPALNIIDTTDYENFIESIAEYCYEPLRNKMLLEIEEYKISKEFLFQYEEFIKTIPRDYSDATPSENKKETSNKKKKRLRTVQEIMESIEKEG